MSLPLSKRADLIGESPIRKLSPYAVQAEKEGVYVYHINIGQPDIPTPEAMRNAYKDIPEVVAYGPSEGLPEFRSALASYYRTWGVPVEKDEIMITNGGSEAIIFTLMAVTSPGDEVIIPEPYYANYNGFAAMAGVHVVPVETSLESGFDLPPIEEFEAKISENTRAILFSNPGNPTGAVFTEEKLRELTELAKRRGIYLISDEVYREFTYDGTRAIPLLSFEGMEEHAVTVDSISKRYSACGARVGSLVTKNERIRKLVLKFAQARLCPPTIDQMAAIKAVGSSENYLKEVIEEYRGRRDTACARLDEIDGALYAKPQGAFYQMVELPVDDTEVFSRWLLEEFRSDGETVMVAPGSGFYARPELGKKRIRVAYILDSQKLDRAFSILKEAVEDYREAKNLHRHPA